MRALPLLLLAALLAGCSQEPAPLVAPPPVFSDAELPSGTPLAPLEWRAIAEASFVIAPAQPFATDVDVPNGTLSTFVNLSFDAGAVHGLAIQLGECRWQRDVGFVGGQSIAVDCGGILDGTSALRITPTAGAMDGSVRVVALVCSPLQGRCPPRLPVSAS